MESRKEVKYKNRIVIKLGTSTIAFGNGKMNFTRLEKLAMIISDLINSGKEVILVSSGAIGVGAGRLKMEEPPQGLIPRQALAAIGQAELIRIYDKFFHEYNQMVAQVLLTRDGIDDETRGTNARNTLNEILRMKIIPIVNENDTVATEEIQFGDNDTLSAKVAVLTQADLLIILSDIDGLYTEDPRNGKDPDIIRTVTDISGQIEEYAAGSSSSFTKGGMKTKIAAARICNENGIDMMILNGNDPANINSALSGEEIGTYFISNHR